MKTLVWGGNALAAGQTVQHDYGVVVEGGRILDAGSRNELTARHPDTQTVGGSSYFLLPGIVDSHDHGRTLGTIAFDNPDDLLEVWLLGLGSQPQCDPYLSAALDGCRLLHTGVTTVVHYHNPNNWMKVPDEAEATIRGYRDAGLRVIFCPPVVNQNSLVYDAAEQFLSSLPDRLRPVAQSMALGVHLSLEEQRQIFLNLYRSFHDHQDYLTLVASNPVGGQWCSDESLEVLAGLAQTCGTRMQMHLLETRFQERYAWRKWGKSFTRHLEDLGLLGPWLTLAHMVHVDPADIELLGERQVGIASNPSSNLRLRSGIAPLAKLNAAGVTVGIGLDGHTLDNDQDYLRELRLAWVLGNLPGVDAPELTANDVLRFGTANGAEISLGREARGGRLEAGALADLVLIDFDAVQGLWYSPEVAPAETLLHQGTKQHVTDVMVHGEWVLRQGQVCRVNEESIQEEVRASLNAWRDAHAGDAISSAHELAPYVRKFYTGWI